MGTEQAVARALIFGSAPCGDWSFLAPYLAEGGWTVFCADGGVKNARHAGLEPDYLIGDWDSGGAPEAGVPSLTLPAEKAMTDLQAAAGQAIALGAKTLLLCGCTGGRLDHTASNLLLLEWIHGHGGTGIIADPDNEVRFLDGGRLRLENVPAFRYLSLIPLDRTVSGVCLRGVKYPLEQAGLRRGDTLPVSNEFAEPAAEISVGSGRALVIRSQRI